MVFGRLHNPDEQFICLVCVHRPDTRSYFDIFPQLVHHLKEVHEMGPSGMERKFW